MRRAFLPVVVLAAAVSGFAPRQAPPSVGAAPSAEQAPAVPTAGDAGTEAGAGMETSGSGLPRRAPPPRTMKDQWPVFAMLAVSWIGIVVYLLVIGRRSRRLAELVERTGRPS